MRGDEQVVVANRGVGAFQRRAKFRVMLVGWFIERTYRQGSK